MLDLFFRKKKFKHIHTEHVLYLRHVDKAFLTKVLCVQTEGKRKFCNNILVEGHRFNSIY